MKKPLKVAGICGIIVLAIALIIGIIAFISTLMIINPDLISEPSYMESIHEQLKPLYFITAIISLILLPFSILYLNGFLTLGKKFNNKLILVLSWIFIISAVLSSLMMIISIFTGDIYLYSSDYSDYTGDNFLGNFAYSLKNSVKSNPVFAPIFRVIGNSNTMFWTLFTLFLILNIAIYILFGIGLFKLAKNQVPLAIVLGIFAILTPLWSLFSFVFEILAIIMFFKTSKKFENPKKEAKKKTKK